jgi:cell filamentation protein
LHTTAPRDQRRPVRDANDVLVNKLGITSAVALSQAEADLSLAAVLHLPVHPLPGSYDLDHLCRFHERIFGAVYAWAGVLRTVDIARTPQDMFCRWPFIESYSAEVFRELSTETMLVGLTRNGFVARLAHYYGEINAVRPFREGNGRSQRAFLASWPATRAGESPGASSTHQQTAPRRQPPFRAIPSR